MSWTWALQAMRRDVTGGGAVTDLGTLHSTDSKVAAPILDFEAEDVRNDVGTGHIEVPAEDDILDVLEEDNLLHVTIEGDYVTSWLVKVADEVVVRAKDAADYTARVALAHILGVTAEGIVDPPGGFDSQPISQERIFDSRDPARDNSDFEDPADLGDARTVGTAGGTYPVTPFGMGDDATGFYYPDTVRVLGVPGVAIDGDAPGGFYPFYLDHDFSETTFYVLNVEGDNDKQAHVDGAPFVPKTLGFGRAYRTQKQLITAGTHRVWFLVENGGVDADHEGQASLAYEFVKVDSADKVTALELCSTTATKIYNHPDLPPPGFTPHEIVAIILAENQAVGCLLDIVLSSTATHDSDGNLWADYYDISFKSRGPLEQFLTKQLSAVICDVDAHFDFETGKIVIDLWNKGAHSTAALVVGDGDNLEELTVAEGPTEMTRAAIAWNDGGNITFTERMAAPAAGHPVKRRPLDLGDARSTTQTARDGDAQTDLFGRKRRAPTFGIAITSETDPAVLPPNWWKWSATDLTLTSRWNEGNEELLSVTLKLDEDGVLTPVPTAGDLIVPALARWTSVARRMAPPSLNGEARPASPNNPLYPVASTSTSPPFSC